MHPIREQFPTLPALLAEVRRRPGLYLTEKSIQALHDQLIGIQFAEDFHDIPEQDRFGGFDLEGFEKWVEQTFNPKRLSVRSSHLARLLAGSDAAAFDLWFEWYDRYLREHPAAATTG